MWFVWLLAVRRGKEGRGAMPMPEDAYVLCCSGMWTQDASWALGRRSRAAVARGSE